MRQFSNRRNILLVIIAIVILPASWVFSAGLRGDIHARYDVAHGHYVIHLYGLPVATFSQYQQLLRKRYGIEVKAMGCILPMTSYYDSYDRVVIAAANQKFGHNVFKEVSDQVDLQASTAASEEAKDQKVSCLQPLKRKQKGEPQCLV